MSGNENHVEVYDEKLAEIYDEIYHYKSYERDVAYVLNCVRQRFPEARSLLEVACGTGNHSGGLSAAFDLEGLDLSPAMLNRARLKHPGILFHQGNMIDFDLHRTYDVVCCLFRTIAFVKTRDNFRRAVSAMARHLRPGGLLLVEPFFTPETYWTDDIKMNLLNEPELKIAWMYVSKREGDLGIMNNHFLVGRPSGVEHFIEEHKMALFSRDDYAIAFEAAGLDLEYDEIGPGNIGFYIGCRRLATP
jgi:ubiquinone/menaquinone biosynthesis C-methylase UbiE